MASTPCSGSAPAASTPWLSTSYQAKPPCSVTTSRPVHSTRMQASGRCRAGSASAPALSHSSSITPASRRSPRRRAPPASSASAARSIAAKPDFMSAAPRPYMRPSRTTGSNASGPHGPTTSRCPSSIEAGAVARAGEPADDVGPAGQHVPHVDLHAEALEAPGEPGGERPLARPARQTRIRAVDAHHLGQQGLELRHVFLRGSAHDPAATTVLAMIAGTSCGMVRRRRQPSTGGPPAERSVHAPADSAPRPRSRGRGGRARVPRSPAAAAPTSGSASPSQAATAAPVKGGTLVATYQGEPQGLDPAIDWEGQGWSIEHTMFNNFVKYASKPGTAGTEMLPDLATEVPTQANGGISRRRQDVHLPPQEGHQVRAAGGP